jgi:hypothetical protein
MSDDALAAQLRDRSVLVRGRGPAVDALIDRLAAAGCTVTTSPPRSGDPPVDAAVISLECLTGTPRDIASRVFDVVDALGCMPRHVVAIVGSGAASTDTIIADRLATTLTIYLTGHTADTDVRVNLVRYRAMSGDDAVGRAVETTLMLMSGLLDAVRGQVLDMCGRQPAMGDAS